MAAVVPHPPCQGPGPEGAPYAPPFCHVCWSYANNPRYRDAPEGHGAAPGAAAPPPCDCPFAGPPVVEGGRQKVRGCGSCPNNARFKLFACTHPAREPEEVTVHDDCRRCPHRPAGKPGARKLVLKNYLSPGDVLAMTAAVRSLHLAHPGAYRVAVDTAAAALWDFNPDVEPLALAREGKWEEVQTHYPLINKSDERAVHFLQGYCDFLESALGVRVPLAVNAPVVHLSNREKSWLPQVHELLGRPRPYWVVNAGRKGDYTAKFWGTRNYQALADALRGRVLLVQVGEAGHHHPPLDGAVNLVGKTDLRQLVRLCYWAQGGVGGVTLLQHLMAALGKPYCCVMGGREPVQWNSYPKQSLFHAVGLLPCCRDRACWKSRTVALGDGDEKDASLCEAPSPGPDPVPACLDLARPEEVAARILLHRP